MHPHTFCRTCFEKLNNLISILLSTNSKLEKNISSNMVTCQWNSWEVSLWQIIFLTKLVWGSAEIISGCPHFMPPSCKKWSRCLFWSSAELALCLPSIIRGFAYIYVFLYTKIALPTYANTNYQVDMLTNYSKCLKNGSTESLQPSRYVTYIYAYCISTPT